MHQLFFEEKGFHKVSDACQTAFADIESYS